MTRFAAHLAGQGYLVRNLGYPSTRSGLSEIVDLLLPRVAEASSAAVGGKVHLIGYSMGGLVIRAILKRYRPTNLGRVVMVGTPNGGSQIADFAKDWPLFRKLYGPAGQQLVTDQRAFAELFGVVDYELGIIAGNRTIDPVSSLIFGGRRVPNDGKVSVESTKLPGAEHIVIAANHTFFPLNREMWRQASAFLASGHFTD